MFRGAVVIYTRLHVALLCVQSWHGHTIIANVLPTLVHISIGMNHVRTYGHVYWLYAIMV